jgi:CubicO group peptidase (beta-lactamase class C family)
VQAVADMASGIDCLDSDGYQDSSTCIYQLEEALGITAPTGRNPELNTQLRGMERLRPPQTRIEYVSANTVVLGLVIEAVTGQSFASTIQALIWDGIGPEADALVAVSPAGYAYYSGGLSLRLRDLARFGEVFTRPEGIGVIDASLLHRMQTAGLELPADAVSELTEIFGEDRPRRSAWQWDYVWQDGALFKGGYDGQGLYVDPGRQLVIAWFGTGLDFNTHTNDMLPVARQLARAGLFDTPVSD